MSTEEADKERRRSERRWVMLRVLVDDQQSVEFSHTVNVSDSGILIERIPELALEQDQIVNVVIQGVLVEGETAEASPQGQAMLVVRVEPERIALTFLD